MRLIDADAIFPNGVFIVNGGNPMTSLDELINRINNAPTVDAVVLPCGVGHTVFYVHMVCDENGEEIFTISIGKVFSFSIQVDGLWAYCRYEDGLTYWHKWDGYFGKTVFLTREEAEAALARMKG